MFDDRTQLSEILNMPEEKIRIIQIPMGGAFGGKDDMILQQHLSLGVLKTGRPVKIVLSREESLRSHPKRHPARMRYKTGADASGKILSVEADIVLDTGAYASLGSEVLNNTCVFGAGPYYVPNLRFNAEAWYTNNVPAGAMRGFGVNQVAIALEQQMDMMARELKIDPFEFRLINALDVGLPTAADHILEEGVVAIKQTIEAARDGFSNEKLPMIKDAKIGVGVASAVKNIGFGHDIPESTGAIVELTSFGKVKIRVSQHEYGQGSVVGLIQLAANTLNIPVKSVELLGPDTANTPKTGASSASRQTFMTGNAVVMACNAFKQEIMHHVANKIECDPLELDISGGYVIHSQKNLSIPLDKLNYHFQVERRYVPPRTHALLESESSHFGKPDFESRSTHWCYTYSTQVTIVAVWPNTGEVKVLKALSAIDLGKVINLKVVEGQIIGGVVMGQGYALSEEFIMENGIPITNTFGKCHVPTADQVPEIKPIIVEVPHPFGPEGAKGFAEGSSLAIAPAILNAIYDAVKIRIKDLPANKDRIKGVLKNQEQV